MSHSEVIHSISNRAEKLVASTKKSGAIHVDAMAVCDTGDSVSIRNGAIESVEREDAQGLGVRAFVETKHGLAFATASSSDLSDSGLDKLASQVVAMARITEPDPDAVPPIGATHPDESELSTWRTRHADQHHGWNLEMARDAAMQCEDIARNYSSDISNSEGADASFGNTHVAYASSDGFAADYAKSSVSLSVSVIAGSGEGMQRDYAWHRAFYASELKSAEEIANEAAKRAVARLNPGSMTSGETTVIFEPRTATSLLGHLIGAINGRAVLQERTFLADALNESIFPDFITIEDNPDHPDGMGNRLFDGEGTRCEGRNIIDSGKLNCFLTDRYTAKRLNQPETGSAMRGLTGDIGIGSSNLIWHPGDKDQQALLKAIGNGLLVTEMIGFGVNGVTGDYSRGAGGFLIENGEIIRPVSGITIAGNLKEMFNNIELVGSDLTWFGSSAVPTIAISGMTVAGQ